jgi:hypothetical protein
MVREAASHHEGDIRMSQAKPTIKVKCISCGKIEWIPLKDYGPLGPACSACMDTVVVAGART